MQKGHSITIKAQRDIITPYTEELRQELYPIVSEGQPAEVIFDLAGVTMIDSVGIGLLVSVYNSLQKYGGTLKLTNISEEIQNLLKHMQLHKRFVIV